jgi:hypothetical protein
MRVTRGLRYDQGYDTIMVSVWDAIRVRVKVRVRVRVRVRGRLKSGWLWLLL